MNPLLKVRLLASENPDVIPHLTLSILQNKVDVSVRPSLPLSS